MKRYYVLCNKVQFKKKPLVLTSLFAGKFNVFLNRQANNQFESHYWSYGFYTIYIKVQFQYINYHRLPQANNHNYLLDNTAQTVQPKRCSQRCNRKTKFSQVLLAIYKFTFQTTTLNQITKPLDH